MMISGDAIRGYIDLMVLSILQDRSSYAYELSHTITEITSGEYTMKQTTLYSAVKRLESQALVDSVSGVSESGKPRTYYQITPAGIEYFSQKCREWEQTKAVVDRFTKGSF